jgi:hypothetical protein
MVNSQHGDHLVDTSLGLASRVFLSMKVTNPGVKSRHVDLGASPIGFGRGHCGRHVEDDEGITSETGDARSEDSKVCRSE